MVIKRGPQVGIYFGHYECFGHTSRVMAVAEVFKKRFSQGNVFFIQAAKRQPKSKIDQLGKVYDLPAPFMDRRHFREPLQGAGANAAERADACLKILLAQAPGLLITEFFPFGREECRHELIPVLAKASSQNIKLWSIAGYPLLTGAEESWREKTLALYDRLIVFSPPEEKEYMAKALSPSQRRPYLDFFKRYESKIKFAGYLLPQGRIVRDDEDENLPKPAMAKGACRVAVLRGGGAYNPKLIAEAILASDVLGNGYYFTVAAGPSTSPQEWYLFNTLLAKKKVKNLVLLRSVGNYEDLIAQSDVCVTSASYHSSVMLMKHRKKAVLVPFEGPEGMNFIEQPSRAAMLKDMMGADILPMADLSCARLAQTIKKSSSSKPNDFKIPATWFEGRDFLDRSFEGLFAP